MKNKTSFVRKIFGLAALMTCTVIASGCAPTTRFANENEVASGNATGPLSMFKLSVTDRKPGTGHESFGCQGNTDWGYWEGPHIAMTYVKSGDMRDVAVKMTSQKTGQSITMVIRDYKNPHTNRARTQREAEIRKDAIYGLGITEEACEKLISGARRLGVGEGSSVSAPDGKGTLSVTGRVRPPVELQQLVNGR